MAISYDSLELNISANVNEATKGIRSLKNSLNALQNAVKGLDFDTLTKVEKHLQNIAKIDFSNVSKGLQDVVNAFKAFNDKKFMADRVKKPSAEEQAKAISFMTAGGTGKFDYTPPYPQIEFDKSMLPTLKGDLGFDVATNSLDKLKVSAEQVKIAMKDTKKAIQDASKEAKKGAGGFEKIVNAFKRIVFYRLVRRAIQLVGQAIKEGIQNMALFDDNFNKSMSELKSSITYLKNSFASVVAPLLNMVAPVLTVIVDLIADVNNELGKMFAILGGANGYAKAIKGAEDYAKSLKKTKDASLGIDELNVVQKDEGQNFVFESITGTGGLGEVFSNIKNTLEPLIQLFKNTFYPIIEKIGKIFEKISPIIDAIVNILSLFFSQTMEGVNDSVGAFLDMIGEIANIVAEIVKMLEPALEGFTTGMSLGLNNINGLLTSIFHWISAFFRMLQPILKLLEPILDIITIIADVLSMIVGGIVSGIVNAIETIIEFITAVWDTLSAVLSGDFNKIGDIWEKLGERIKGIWKGVANFFIDTLNSLLHAVENFANFFVGIAGKVASWFGADTSGWGVHIQPIQRLATGGIVEDGFFYANHNELVGQFSNGKTAVANNEQITTGIYQAVLQAMNDSATGGGREIVLKIDGKEIGRASEKYEAQKGDKTIFTGGYHYGY